MGAYSQTLLFCLLSVYLWNKGEACSVTASSSCTTTFINNAGQSSDVKQICQWVNTYYDCLKDIGCWDESAKQSALKLFEQYGYKCDSTDPSSGFSDTSCSTSASSSCYHIVEQNSNILKNPTEKICPVVYTYFNCLANTKCTGVEEIKQKYIKSLETESGIKCGSNVFGLNSFLVFSILITAVINFF